MSDFRRCYEVMIDAPMYDVFDDCRYPRHLFQGWPQLEVRDTVLTPTAA